MFGSQFNQWYQDFTCQQQSSPLLYNFNLEPSHPSAKGLLFYFYIHPIDPLGIHLLQCPHGIDANDT
jgi:hypothetical protein